MKKCKFYVFYIKTKITTLTVQIHFILQNHPMFHSKKRWVNLVRRRERFVGQSSYLFMSATFKLVLGGFISLEGYVIHPHMSATFKLALGGFISLEGSVIHPQRFYGGMSEIESVRRRWAKCFSIKLPCRAYILYIL